MNLSSPEVLAERDIPKRWYEKGRKNAFIPVWLGGLSAGYLSKHFGIVPDSTFLKTISGFTGTVVAALIDRKTSRDLIDRMEVAKEFNINFHYAEMNGLLENIENRDDFVKNTRSTKILGLEAAIAGIGALGWEFASPLIAIRGIAALNNSRKAARVEQAIMYAQEEA